MVKKEKNGRKHPTPSTVKRLFAVSRNICAFPKCQIPIVDPASGTVTGKICHIRAHSPDGPRFDQSQSVDERRDFENLILMCPMHHDVIDADEESYTIDRLKTIKAEHESAAEIELSLSDKQAEAFVTNISNNTVSEGSIIVTNNQVGGQNAHQIVNVGPQPRRIDQAAGAAISESLAQHPPEEVTLCFLLGDTETEQLAEQVSLIVRNAGWIVSNTRASKFNGLPKGIVVDAKTPTIGLSQLASLLRSAGLRVQCNVNDRTTITRVIIGANFE